MPFLEDDAWCHEFYKGIKVPRRVRIPADDVHAYRMNLRENWVYDKLRVAKAQMVKAEPHGVIPDKFPVVSKPITNLYGCGKGVVEFNKWPSVYFQKPGYFWMEKLKGPEYSIDLAWDDGCLVWSQALEAVKDKNGSFLYWKVIGSRKSLKLAIQSLDWFCGMGYTGMMNIEVIDDQKKGPIVIDAHLRFSSQFVDLLGGKDFLQDVIDLYNKKGWKHRSKPVVGGCSYVIRVNKKENHPGKYKVDWDGVEQLRKKVSSIQIFVDETVPIMYHPNDIHSYRLAAVNCVQLKGCKKIANELRKLITAKG